MRKFPDFLCVGFQKCGTTWLHRNLKTHPNIWLPPVKETHYFNERYEGSFLGKIRNHIKHLSHLFSKPRYSKQLYWLIRLKFINHSIKNFRWSLRYFFWPRNDTWYSSLFQLGGNKILGEIAPTYASLNKKQIAHIHALMPEAKVIFIIRNPILSAWSHLQMNFRNRNSESIEDLTESEIIEELSDSSLINIDYIQAIDNWKTYYPEKQVLVVFFDEILEKPDQLLHKICQFIGAEIDKDYEKQIFKTKVNASSSQTKMPQNIAVYLANNYHDKITRLSQLFAGSANIWLTFCEDILREK